MVPRVHRGPVAGDEVGHPRALQHHRDLPGEERIFRRVEISSGGLEIRQGVGAQTLGEAANPVHGGDGFGGIDGELAGARVIELAAEPESGVCTMYQPGSSGMKPSERKEVACGVTLDQGGGVAVELADGGGARVGSQPAALSSAAAPPEKCALFQCRAAQAGVDTRP